MVARPVAKWLAVPALMILIALAAVVLLLGQPTQASSSVTARVSVDSAGEQRNSGSSYAALSADGRYVALAPAASPGDDRSLSDDPTLLSQTVSAGGYHTCGVRTDGILACWGYNGNGQAAPPAGTFTQVSAGGFHTCGVRTDGTPTCWGTTTTGRRRPPPAPSPRSARAVITTAG